MALEGQRYQIGEDVARRPSSRISGASSRCLTPRGLEMRAASRASPCGLEEDPEVEFLGVEPAARSRRGVRLFPFNIHAKSVVDQVVFNHNLDHNIDETSDMHQFQALYQDSAGRPSWKDQLRCKQLAPRKSGDTWGPIEDPRTMPIVPGGRRKFAGPVSKSVVDDILFGRDIDNSGTERDRFYAMEVLHTGAAGAPSWRPNKGNSAPGSHRTRHLKQRAELLYDLERAARLTSRLCGATARNTPRDVYREATPEPSTARSRQSANALPLAVAKAFAMLEALEGKSTREAWK